MRALLGLPLALSLAGCGERFPPGSLAPPPARHSASDYREVRQRWTRSARIIKTLDTTLHVFATLFSLDFASAYLAKRTEVFRLGDAERDALGRELADAADRFYSFFVSAATDDFQWNDFARKESVWHLLLRNDRGEQVSPLEIHADKITPTATELFPYVGPFHRVYRVRFPAKLPDGRPLARGDTQSLSLVFTGPLGQADLKWRLR